MIDQRSLKKLNKDLSIISQALIKTVNDVPNEVTKELAIGANDIRNTIIKSIRSTPKTGKHYKRGSRFHIASSPGKPPAIDSGELVRSVFFDVRPWEVEIGNYGGGSYWEYLETGTLKFFEENIPPAPLIEPRPSLEPAVKKHHEEIIERVGEGVFELITDSVEKAPGVKEV